jgi:hypothetical protein
LHRWWPPRVIFDHTRKKPKPIGRPRKDKGNTTPKKQNPATEGTVPAATPEKSPDYGSSHGTPTSSGTSTPTVIANVPTSTPIATTPATVVSIQGTSTPAIVAASAQPVSKSASKGSVIAAGGSASAAGGSASAAGGSASASGISSQHGCFDITISAQLEKKRILKYWRSQGKDTPEMRGLSPDRLEDKNWFARYEATVKYAEKRGDAEPDSDDDMSGN